MKKTIYPLPGQGAIASSGTFAGKVAFSSGVKVDGGELLFISGCLAFDEKNQLVGKGDMEAQTRQVLKNIESVLKKAGGGFRDVIRVQVFVTDLSDFQAVHRVRWEFFEPDHLPASTLVQISGLVHPDAMIEIDAVAVLAK